MDMNNIRHVSSAGYRLPERSNGIRPIKTQPPRDRTRCTEGEVVSLEQNPDKTDPVKKNLLWKELVRNEKRGIRNWEKNWTFLCSNHQMGQQKSEEPLPSYVSVFSDRFPNTTSQMFGSRLSTPLGRELVRLDRKLIWSASLYKCKLDPELLPS